uniref:Tip120-family protein n=1 Tax=Kwoniella dejecticola CBS 10117 TaxID=1296121 RepID=A0A1A6AFX1_9TREE|nr:tip120-family protein [Kwoniella dejecticola CBS 10117]OBR88956.1 tip120-family protein [Kwoniella dejecticola CBS 10117]
MSKAPGQLNVQLSGLLEKMRSTDSDHRVMALIDLNKELTRSLTPIPTSSSSSTPIPAPRRQEVNYTDEYTETTLSENVLKLLGDSIAEVKSAAVSCISLMVRRPRPNVITNIVNSLLDGVSSHDEEKRDISCLALKSVVSEMPVDGQQVTVNVEKIVARVFALFKNDINPQLASELLQTLTDLFNRFAYIVKTSQSLQNTSITSLTDILSTGRPAIRKRAIPTVSALVSSNPGLFDTALKAQIVGGLSNDAESIRVWLGVIATLARGGSVHKIGTLMAEGNIGDVILKQTQNPEDTETVEAALVALEVLVLRCPTEIAPYVQAINERALALVKYDPNYVDLDDDDVDMDGEEEGDEDEDDFEDDAYSDDEDDSWKIRRSAAKLLLALIGTRNELLVDFYNTAAPVLISRFSEREESVRLEVLAAFEVLLRQTASARVAEVVSGGRNKRKRSEGMDEDYAPDDSVVSYLRVSLPQITRAILKQISSKSVSTRQQCFVLLREVSKALNGGLDDSANAICAAATSAIRSVDSSTSASLAIAALSFLSAFFVDHPARVYGEHLGQLVPAVVRCMKDKLQRISFEAFSAASSLAQAARPKNNSSPLPPAFDTPIRQLFDATTEILADNSVDGDVRERALDTLGYLLVHEGDVFISSYTTALPLIASRLASENTVTTAVTVIGKLAESPLCKGSEFEAWLLQVLPEVVVALRRSKRSTTKTSEFTCLSHILMRLGTSLPEQTAIGMIGELQPLIETPAALQVVSLILSQQQKCRESVDAQLSPTIMSLIKTPSSNQHLAEALAAFFAAYVDGDPDCVTRLVPALVENLGKHSALPDATRGGTSTYTTTARIVGTAVAHSQRNAAGVLALFQKVIKSSKVTEPDVYLSLLCIGEIGRTVDLSTTPDLLDKILSFFSAESEEVRSNLAVGAPKVFLPAVIKQIETVSSEPTRLLLLHSLKEVILHSSPAQLELLADTLWKPLFADDVSTKEGDIGDDGVRNVKAACIGKLTTTAPGKFLPQLQELLRSSPKNRAIVAAAVRYTFIDTSSSYDEIIAPIIVDFLSLMQDANLVVRRLSLASLNSAIQHKPHLIVDKLSALQPLLYNETHIKKELQREVVMGPFKVIEDDGLENRKTAYETMYTLLGTCFSKIDLPTFTERVMASLSDVNEVKILGLMLLLRLGQMSPTSVISRLDDVVVAMKGMMKDVEVKDDTVKQDLERKEEMQRSTLRTAVPLYKLSNPQQAPQFHAFVSGLLASDKWRDFKDYQG